MAPLTRKRRLSNYVEDDSLHFFKIILPQTIAEKKLKIPKKFVIKFGHELSNVGTFVLPHGRYWEIGLTKANGSIWLDDGWHKFVDYNSIRDGYFLVFRYERYSTFHVIIFDHTACEIDYPSYVASDDNELNDGESEKHSIHQDNGTEEDDSLEILGIKTPNLDERANRAISRKRDASSKQSLVKKPPRNAASRKNSVVKQAPVTRIKRPKSEEVVFDNLNESRQILSNKREQRRSRRLWCNNTCPMNLNAMSLHDQKEYVQLQQLKQQYDGKKLKITIQRANLQSLELKLQGNEANKGTKSGKQEQGSIQYEEIEVYVSQMLFSVNFTYNDRERAVRAVKVLKPKNPCFMIIVHFSSSNVHVPAGFATDYLTGVSDHIRVQGSNGREWSVRIRRVERFGLYMQMGWTGFWGDNNLKQGDVCIFELTDKKAAVHKLSIFRKKICLPLDRTF